MNNETTPQPLNNDLSKLLGRLEKMAEQSEAVVRFVNGKLKTETPPPCPSCKRPSQYNENASLHQTIEGRRNGSIDEKGVLLVPALCATCASLKLREAQTTAAIERGVPGNLAAMDWASWEPEDRNDVLAKTTAQAFAKNKGSKEKPILYLHGAVGTGKSSLAVCIVKAWTRKIAWVNQVSFVGKIRRQYRQRTPEEHPVDIYTRPSLLVLDEFGLMSGGRDEIANLYELLNNRIAEGKATVITSNKHPNNLVEEVGEAIVSRILSAAQVLELKGTKR